MAMVQWNPTMLWRPFQQPWSPFEGLESLRHEMDRLFASFAGTTQPSGIRQSEWMPRVDLLEHENAFVLVADLPGMQQEDIQVSVHDNVLTLEGKRTFEHVENGVGIELRRARPESTFPQAPLRSRTVGFPEYGSDPGFPLQAFRNMRKLKRWLAYTPLISRLPLGSSEKAGSSDSCR